MKIFIEFIQKLLTIISSFNPWLNTHLVLSQHISLAALCSIWVLCVHLRVNICTNLTKHFALESSCMQFWHISLLMCHWWMWVLEFHLPRCSVDVQEPSYHLSSGSTYTTCLPANNEWMSLLSENNEYNFCSVWLNHNAFPNESYTHFHYSICVINAKYSCVMDSVFSCFILESSFMCPSGIYWTALKFIH